ncbi:MAG: CDP-diacylglycerol--serine O-phosphatidyltransferase [Verrucomicrobia bacterium]|nr:CDP-diacylglycerol--serine O-phosphatidyltransferase [Verrucomicrobiota bacterium]
MTKPPHREPPNPDDPYSVVQASRIFFLPNLMTAGNLFCGFMAILQCIQARLAETSLTGEYGGSTSADHYRYAVWFIFGAAAFDTLDGRLARLGGRESLFGAEFDSLADVISFGIAPALLMLYLIISPTQAQDYQWFRNIGWFVGFIYLLCAAMRLARFNVITNPLLRPGTRESSKDFVGLPVPAAASTVAATVLFLLRLSEMDRSLKSWALSLPPLMLLVAFLMMSTVRYPSGKNLNMQTKTRLRPFVALFVVIGLVIFYKEYAALGICLGYIFFGLFRHVRHGRSGTESPEGRDILPKSP